MSTYLRDARAARTVSALRTEGALILDLSAESAALAAAGARHGTRSIVHASDQLAEWEIALALRPPSVRGFELAVAQLLEEIGTELDSGWRGSCGACGQPLRIAAWRWESAAADEDSSRRPTARRATCAACKNLGRRGDASAMRPGEAAVRVELSEEQRREAHGATGGAAERRWTPRQLSVFLAARRALARSNETASTLAALRVAVSRAALLCARPADARESEKAWWEIAPWQALADVVDEQRRALLLARELPRDLSLSGDLVNLSYPGHPVILMRASGAARTAVAGLNASASLNAALIHLHLGREEQVRVDRALGAALAGGDVGDVDPALRVDPNDASSVTAAIARIVVAIDPLIKSGSGALIEVPATIAALAGTLTAVSMAGGLVTGLERTHDEGDEDWWWIAVSIPPAAARGARSVRSGGGRISGDALQRLVADILVERGEPTAPEHLLMLYAVRRSASGELLESGALIDEFNELLALRDTLRPMGSLDRLVATAGRRIFVEGRAERERLTTVGGDRDDAQHWAAAASGAAAGHAEGEDPELAELLRDAYVIEDELGVRPRWPGGNRSDERLACIASLLKVGAAMGLHSAIAPSLEPLLVGGLPLGRQVARDPIETSPPLRHRSDRAAFDQIDVLLFRRGKSLLMCEVQLGPLPLGALLLGRHAKVATDREVVRLLVTDRALLRLAEARLKRDERLAAAWEEGNWHLLATDQLARLAQLANPRLADLERYLGAGPLERSPGAQLDLGSFGWEAS
ncbi:MAG: hypothetical protein ACO38C_01970 [Candidatus Limnocylindrus sp.]